MKNLTLAASLAAMLCGLATPHAHAMDYSYRVVKNVVVFDAQGEIEFNEYEHFIAWALHLPPAILKLDAKAMVFNSRGGNLVGGMALGVAVERLGLNTGVAAGGQCASACVFAWGAGKAKSTAPDAGIFVHLPSHPDGAANAAIDSNIVANSAQWLVDHGAPYNVIAAFQSTPSASVYELTAADLAAWHVRVTY